MNSLIISIPAQAVWFVLGFICGFLTPFLIGLWATHRQNEAAKKVPGATSAEGMDELIFNGVAVESAEANAVLEAIQPWVEKGMLYKRNEIATIVAKHTNFRYKADNSIMRVILEWWRTGKAKRFRTALYGLSGHEYGGGYLLKW